MNEDKEQREEEEQDALALQDSSAISVGNVNEFYKSEINTQIETALRHPRQLSQVKRKMLAFATLDQETAEECFYSLPRGGKTIKGPSVRLAEIAAVCYKNIRIGTRVVDIDSTSVHPSVTAQGVAMDLESNVLVTMEKRRRITAKKDQKGGRRPIDEDDINLAANACSAIVFRDVTFKIVPGVLVNQVYEKTIRVAIGSDKTIVERRQAALARLAKMGISEAQVLSKLERSAVEDIDIADLETLFGLHNAIRDGQTTIDEAFKPKVPETPPPKSVFGASPAMQQAHQQAPVGSAEAPQPATAAPATLPAPQGSGSASHPPAQPPAAASAPAKKGVVAKRQPPEATKEDLLAIIKTRIPPSDMLMVEAFLVAKMQIIKPNQHLDDAEVSDLRLIAVDMNRFLASFQAFKTAVVPVTPQ